MTLAEQMAQGHTLLDDTPVAVHIVTHEIPDRNDGYSFDTIYVAERPDGRLTLIGPAAWPIGTLIYKYDHRDERSGIWQGWRVLFSREVFDE